MLGADVVVPHLERLAERELEHLLGARGEGDVARRGLRASADDLLDPLPGCIQGDAHRHERPRGDALALM